MPYREIKEAKSLRWLAVQFPKVENPKDDIDKMQNCINIYCTNAADFIYNQQAEIERLQGAVQEWVDGKCLSQKHLLMIGELQNEIETAKAEAIKEFAERLKENYTKPLFFAGGYIDFIRVVDNLVKEMEG